MKPMDKSFKVFNTNRIKNKEVTQFASLKLKINRHMKHINVVVMNLNGIDMFLGYDQFVKHNPEVNQNTETIQFNRCSKECKI